MFCCVYPGYLSVVGVGVFFLFVIMCFWERCVCKICQSYLDGMF